MVSLEEIAEKIKVPWAAQLEGSDISFLGGADRTVDAAPPFPDLRIIGPMPFSARKSP